MSPIWLTSNRPTAERTALCSATRPPLAGYSTGISQPPKLTIFAPKRRCIALSGVLRSSAMGGVVTDSIPYAQEEIDSNTRLEQRQRRARRVRKRTARGCMAAQSQTGKVIGETRHDPNVQLAGIRLRQVEF